MDYRAVPAAINALGANQRDLTARVGEVESRLSTAGATAQDTNVRVRSLEEGMAEVKDFLVRALDRQSTPDLCGGDASAGFRGATETAPRAAPGRTGMAYGATPSIGSRL